MEILGMLFFGGLAGFIASAVMLVWSASIWAVFVQKRSGSPLDDGETDVPPLTAFKRISLALPFLALIHPAPWLVGLIVYVTVLFVVGGLGFEWIWFFLAFYGWILYTVVLVKKESIPRTQNRKNP